MNGFLGTGASFRADLNLVVQLAMGFALLVGMFLARRRRFRAHKYVQSSVMLLNLAMIFLIMAPSFHNQVESHIPAELNDSYYAVATAHAALGTLAEMIGLYIVLVAATKLLPARLRFKRYKPWMRAELALWWIVVLIGIGTYYVWYMKPEPPVIVQASSSASEKLPDRVTITIKNFEFNPKEVEIAAGGTVEWIDVGGRHSVIADDGSFKSNTLAREEKFERKFDKAGEYTFHCGEHPGGTMTGLIRVKEIGK